MGKDIVPTPALSIRGAEPLRSQRLKNRSQVKTPALLHQRLLIQSDLSWHGDFPRLHGLPNCIDHDCDYGLRGPRRAARRESFEIVPLRDYPFFAQLLILKWTFSEIAMQTQNGF